ncbi:MAG: histidinol-phosphate transaminase [Balneolaceae bacterium]
MSPSKKASLVPPNIEELNPYIPGKTIAEVVDTYQPEQISKLASNENRLGYSPKVNQAVENAVKTINDYPDPLSKELRKAIAKRNKVEPSNVIVGSGSESLLSILCRTFFQNKQNIITADVTFIGMFVQAKIRGVKLKKIPVTKDYRFDVTAIANAIDEYTKMIYIANPNNPTGTYINTLEFEWLMKQIPEDIIVIMDEAYYEYANHVNDYPDVLSYDFKNVVVLRTFSKGYGLAGFRVGYGIGPVDLIGYMYKTKMAFEPGGIGQAAALAAFQDENFLDQSIKMVNEGREELYQFFEENDVDYVRSVSNFVLMVFKTEEEAIYLTEKMLEKGVILRRINAFGLPNCIRVTVGLKHQLAHFMNAYKQIYP